MLFAQLIINILFELGAFYDHYYDDDDYYYYDKLVITASGYLIFFRS